MCECGKSFKFYPSLCRHRRENHMNIPRKGKCKTCGFIASETTVRQHEISQHGANDFVCDVENCRKQYKYKENLHRHKREKHFKGNPDTLLE